MNMTIGIASLCGAQSVPCLIPQPDQIAVQDGHFQVTDKTVITASGEARFQADLLIESLAPAMGARLKLLEQASNDTDIISLVLEHSLSESLGEEGYRLDVSSQSIRIQARKPTGLFYGIQTLRQLLPPAILSLQPVEQIQWTVPCVSIVDAPRFGWRGLMLDPARHFIPVPDVKRYIDIMALHKYNRLHFHLTDEPGWRIEIKKYPDLTRVGSRMDWTELQSDTPSPDQAHCVGFYTQDEIRDLVRYAAQRHILIVPEIEMPAHSTAAIVSYPQLSLNAKELSSLSPEQRWKAKERLLAARPQTISFLQDVLLEVLELFPSPWIHIGGDEAEIIHWKNSPEMQDNIQQLGLKDETELHGWFMRQMDSFVTQHGRRTIGWDEILQGGLAPGATVMSWRGQEGGITAAQAGHDVIMAPTSHTYFDYYQGPPQSEPKAIGGDLPLEKVLQFELVPSVLNAEQARHILGGQGQLWGEFISDTRHLQYMTWPRAAALAEILWSSKPDRNPESFRSRLTGHLKRLDAAQVYYRPL